MPLEETDEAPQKQAGWNQTGGIWHRGDAPPQQTTLTTPITPTHADRNATPQYDGAGHRLADEGFDNPTVFLNAAEQKQRALQFAGGRILQGGAGGAPAQPVTTTGAESLLIGSRDKHIFTMLPSGEFVMADAYAEMARLKGGAQVDRRFHHTSLAQGKDVAAAGEMVVDNGVLQKITDQSGHYFPRPELTRQAIAELAEGGIPIERAELELTKKSAVTPAVRGGAMEILGYDAGDKHIQEKMLFARGKKGKFLDEVKQLGAEAEDGHNILPSSIKERAQANATSPVSPPLATNTPYATGLPPIGPMPASTSLPTNTIYKNGLPPMPLPTNTIYKNGLPPMPLSTNTIYKNGLPQLGSGLDVAQGASVAQAATLMGSGLNNPKGLGDQQGLNIADAAGLMARGARKNKWNTPASDVPAPTSLPTSTVYSNGLPPINPMASPYHTGLPPIAPATPYKNGLPPMPLSTNTIYKNGLPPIAPATSPYHTGLPPIAPATSPYKNGLPPIAPASPDHDDDDEGLDLHDGANVAGAAALMAGGLGKKKKNPLSRAKQAVIRLFGNQF